MHRIVRAVGYSPAADAARDHALARGSVMIEDEDWCSDDPPVRG